MNDQRDEYPDLRDALAEFKDIRIFKIFESEETVSVRYDGRAQPSYVFAQLNYARLLPKGFGLLVYRQEGLKK